MRFFFYGTLMAGSGNAVAQTIHRMLQACGPAQARGRLYAIPDQGGWYPAMLPGEGVVHGMLYETLPAFGRSQIAMLDRYEECDPGRRGQSLYCRTAVRVVRQSEGLCRALAYIFNQPLPSGAKRIADGNFPAWLERKGVGAYSPSRS